MDGYFEFDPNGTVIFNLDGSNQKGNYEIKNKTIQISNAPLDGNFEIISVNNDSMQLSLTKTFNNIPYDFEFMLKKTKK